ncbi:MAG TPA: hypothetical protein PK760_06985 [Flavobacteriales bacterium]|nr:hypothetical protein [Flavobacteriales bacterium]
MLVAVKANAQGDTGAGVMVFASTMSPGRADGHESVSFTDVTTPGLGLSVYHVDRNNEKKANAFFSLTYLRRSFHVAYSNGGLGGGTDTEARVDLDVLYLGFGPEFRTDPSGKLTFRFGPLFGVHTGGYMTGTGSTWSMSSGTQTGSFQHAPASIFKGDARLLLAFSWKSMITDRIGWSLDPIIQIGLSSMMKDYRTSGMDMGIAVGLFWRSREPVVPAQ